MLTVFRHAMREVEPKFFFIRRVNIMMFEAYELTAPRPALTNIKWVFHRMD